jgi:3',5'-cyclic AMP phosphodiesterase CpdA
MEQRYGSFDRGEFRFLVLDTNDVSTYAHRADTPEFAAAEQELAKLKAAKAKQAQSWNGGIGPKQLAWIERTCAEARTAGKKVIIFAHHPVRPAAMDTVWNDEAVLAVIDRSPNIVAWLNGHNHAGNFAERNGIPFVTMHGMVETADTSAFATARILSDRMVIAGHGREPSRELVFRQV